MKLSLPFTLLAADVVSLTWAKGAATTGGPRAGQRALEVRHSGLGPTDNRRLTTACLPRERLRAGAERAALAALGSAQEPRCTIDSLQRDGAHGQWRASCSTPRGAVKGGGQSQSTPDAMDLQQTLQIDSPMGVMVLRMNINARRTGDCA